MAAITDRKIVRQHVNFVRIRWQSGAPNLWIVPGQTLVLVWIGCLLQFIINGWPKDEILDGIGWVFDRISSVENGSMFGSISPADITWSLAKDLFRVFEEIETPANHCLSEVTDFIFYSIYFKYGCTHKTVKSLWKIHN